MPPCGKHAHSAALEQVCIVVYSNGEYRLRNFRDYASARHWKWMIDDLVLLMIPSAVEWSVLSYVVSCLWPISERGVRMTVPYLALTKRPPYPDSATEGTTCLSTVA
jgi:hypothetical protein